MILTNKNSILEALKAGRRVRGVSVHSGARADGRVDEILAECKRLKIPVEWEDMKSRSEHGEGARPVVRAECADFQYADAEDIFSGVVEGGGMKLAVALDHILDPRNLGAVIRVCAAGGVAGVILEKKSCCKVTDSAADTSSGGIERVKVARVANLSQIIEKAKKAGFWIAGAGEDGKTDLWNYDFAFPALLVMGSEDKGLRRLVRENCDDIVRIPTSGNFSTLNVSTATAIMVFEARRKWMMKR